MAKKSSPPNLIKKPDAEPKKEKIETATAPGWMWFVLFLATILIIIGVMFATHEPAPAPKKQGATATEKWVHGWTDEADGRMKTFPTTVVIGRGIINFSYTYGRGAKGRGAGTLQADGSYIGTWSDSCGNGTFWLKQEGNASHYTGWQTANGKPGKKFPMFLTKIK